MKERKQKQQVLSFKTLKDTILKCIYNLLLPANYLGVTAVYSCPHKRVLGQVTIQQLWHWKIIRPAKWKRDRSIAIEYLLVICQNFQGLDG